MIGLDTNVLVRFLVRDDEQQAEKARALLESLTADRPGFVCREVVVELVWVLERAYGLSPGRIAKILVELVATEGLVIEEAGDVARAAIRYRTSGGGFSESDDPGGGRTRRSGSALHLRQKSSADRRRFATVNCTNACPKSKPRTVRFRVPASVSLPISSYLRSISNIPQCVCGRM